MKYLRCLFSFSALALFSILTSFALAGSMPPIQVMVSNSTNKVVYKGSVGSQGSFSTPPLEPGNYVVQFNSKRSLDGNVALVVAAGKKKVAADSVAGDKFAKGGVAMRIEVGRSLNITGQISDLTSTSDPKYKIVKGKKYVWVPSELGSNIGGRWVEAGSPAAQSVVNMSQQSLRDAQDRSNNTSAPPGGGH